MAPFFMLLHTAVVASFLMGIHPESVSPTDPEVLQAADYAIGLHNLLNNYTYAFKVTAVKLIFPPARVMYKMTVEVGQTVCENKPNITLTHCKLWNSMMTCDFVVLTVPHTHIPKRLLKDQCN
uniref:Cystatin domain-containing protein n=1 Tax=Scleropages formosus TaxID=113540 RepID=A0A8C9SDP3_SCLFO